jgi:glycosyltransferase involved in cell wall biosynthesis
MKHMAPPHSHTSDISFNGRFLTQAVTGVQRFARETIRSFAQLGFADGAEAIAPPSPPPIDDCFTDMPVRQFGRHSGHRWEQSELSQAAGDSLLINMCGTAPCFRRRQLVVLHDASVAALPQSYTLAFRAWYQVMIRSYAARSQRIATVSKFSADEICRYFGIPRSQIEIVPESGEHVLRTEPDYSVLAKHGLEEDNYFVAVSSQAYHKNFAAIVKAVSQLPEHRSRFVIVGGQNSTVFNRGAINAEGVVKVGFVSDGQLRALYERASCLVYPSLYEGFGVPPLEAMASGCPVLVSRTASLPEVCGDAASYCDPHDPGDIARQLAKMLESRAARQEYREAGWSKSREWTWAQAARSLKDIIVDAR